ncbi:hypothetical protein DF186_22070, partial [Enterococcus hirae]
TRARVGSPRPTSRRSSGVVAGGQALAVHLLGAFDHVAVVLDGVVDGDPHRPGEERPGDLHRDGAQPFERAHDVEHAFGRDV